MSRRKKKHADHVNHERWLVSYADFITLLFAFFTTLYSISVVDQKKVGKLQYSMLTALNLEFFQSKSDTSRSTTSDRPAIIPVDGLVVPGLRSNGGGECGKGRGEMMRALAEKIEQVAGKSGLKGRLSVRLEARGLVVSLAEAGFFQSGSGELRAGALTTLDAIARELSRNPVDLLVEGHTDNVPVHRGRYGSNWELSTARATFVVAYFLGHHGFAPGRLSAVGHGEFKPIAANNTPDGRAKNRRVDIVVRSAP